MDPVSADLLTQCTEINITETLSPTSDVVEHFKITFVSLSLIY